MMLDGTEIMGVLHCPPSTRTLDFLNRGGERFVAVTEATVLRAERTQHISFVAVNKSHILHVVEDVHSYRA